MHCMGGKLVEFRTPKMDETIQGTLDVKPEIWTIRATLPEDALNVSVCVTRVAQERKFLLKTSGFSPSQTRNYLDFIRKKGGVHLVALGGGAIVGWCDIAPGMFDGSSHVGRLGLGLIPPYRNQGLGKRLLCQAIETAFMGSIERIELEVLSSNHRAIRLYKDTGFHEEGRKQTIFSEADRIDDILLFGLFREEWQLS